MARYRVDEAHFLDNKYFEAGAIVEWEGAPSKHMTPVEQVAEERKARYDGARPHYGVSRDLPPRAAMLHSPLARQPGMPRVAGPPGQTSAVSADPANPERTADLVEARRERADQDAKALDEALKPDPKKAKADPAATASPKPAVAPAAPSKVEAKADTSADHK